MGFGFSLLLLLISSVASYNSITNLMNSNRMVGHTDSVIQRLEELISTLKDAETGQRGFLLTKDDKFLDPYNGAYQKSLNILNEVRTLTVDNSAQQQSTEQLRSVITNRLTALEHLIDLKRKDMPIDIEYLQSGKKYMDEARALIALMEGRERALLNIRSASLEKYTTFTPIVIVSAAILSLAITIMFFFRIIADVNKRAELQKELEDKDADITRRINIIQDLADKIADGDYNIRVKDSGADSLGSVASSLNKMSEALQYSFNTLSDKEWQQSGIAMLNEKILGEKDLDLLTNIIVNFISEYTNSQAASYYLVSESGDLEYAAGFAVDIPEQRRKLSAGKGFAGQSLLDGKDRLFEKIDEHDVFISYAAGDLKPRTIFTLPTLNEGKVNGVIELYTIYEYSKIKQEFLRAVAGIAGIAINSAQSRKKLQELLEETQAQSEELQAQQNELELLNTELETQTESLQASEEELKMQQAELQQSNVDLEERTRLLEEKNQMIAERNVEIQQKAEQLEQSTKYKSEFLANMSHELRTPLNSILLLSRLLSENNEHNLNEEQIESAKVIQSSGNGLLSLIDEILDLSKIEAGKMDVEYADISVNEIVDDLRSIFAPVAREKKLELKFNVKGSVPAIFETDKMRLEQILKNLISNAIKFTSTGSVSVNIETDGTDEQPSLLFKVIDTGIGIPADKLDFVFEAFRQADGSTKRKYGGTGLGLSISRELTKLLGGNITVQSTEGKGSIFAISVPVMKGTVIDEPLFKPLIHSSETHHEKHTAGTEPEVYIGPEIPDEIPDDRDNIVSGDNTVLIIEDDTAFAKSLLSFTRKSGYKGVVVVRGDMAQAFAYKYKPVAILLDIMLPLKNGWQIMDELKRDPKTRHIPVHMMSSTDARKESLLSGAVDFISKPMAVEQMHEMFTSLKDALTREPRKVLIVEENTRHAQALEYYLSSFNINSQISSSIKDSMTSLQRKEIDCVIMDMGVPDQHAYETLETVKQMPGFEKLPIIVFTGKNLSRVEESRIKQYADSIVLKTAHSYQRILDEVGLFLHLVEGSEKAPKPGDGFKKLGALEDVLKGKKVLIADDDVRNIFSLTKSLEHNNMKVISAIDGKDAVQQLGHHPDVDIVLMDMMMPEMDGYESIRKIRQMPAFRNLPILAVTAKAMTGDRNKCIAAGASDYISKPVDIDQLLSLLRVWLYESKK